MRHCAVFPYVSSNRLASRFRRRRAVVRGRSVYFERDWERALSTVETDQRPLDVARSLTRYARLHGGLTVKGRKLRIDRSAERMRAAWSADGADYPGNFSRFHLTADQMDRILAAPGKPIALSLLDGLDQKVIGLQEGLGQTPDTTALAYRCAVREIEALTCGMEYSAIYRTTQERQSGEHAKRLLARGGGFAQGLRRDVRTIAVAGRAFPPRRLAYLLREFEDLIECVFWEACASKQREVDERKRRTRSDSSSRTKAPSALEQFIRTDLVGAYEAIFGAAAGRSRRSDGTLGGPFIAFGTCFFSEVGYPVTGETISRALAPRWGKLGRD